MPTYDYACAACGHAFEHFQSMSDRLLRTCPKCGKKRLVRQVGAGAGLIFKGSGFYETDYKRASPAAPSSPPAKGPAGGCGGGACGGDPASCPASDASSKPSKGKSSA